MLRLRKILLLTIAGVSIIFIGVYSASYISYHLLGDDPYYGATATTDRYYKILTTAFILLAGTIMQFIDCKFEKMENKKALIEAVIGALILWAVLKMSYEARNVLSNTEVSLLRVLDIFLDVVFGIRLGQGLLYGLLISVVHFSIYKIFSKGLPSPTMKTIFKEKLSMGISIILVLWIMPFLGAGEDLFWVVE